MAYLTCPIGLWLRRLKYCNIVKAATLAARAFWQTFTGLESMLKTVSPPSMALAMDWRIFPQASWSACDVGCTGGGWSGWNGIRTVTVQPIEKIDLVVNTECLRCDGKCHDLQVGERGDNPTTRNISFLIYLISCKLFTYLKDFSGICNEVAHIYDNST